MKKIIKKKWLAACVATLTFLGLQGSIVMAMDHIDGNTAKEMENKSQQTDISNKSIHKEILKENKMPINITSNEEDLLARLVEAEAKGESYEGKVAVAEVVINRVESSEFPDTVSDVVYEKVGKAYAFSPVQNGEIENPATDKAKKAVKEALSSSDNLGNALYFYNPDIATEDWIRTRKIIKSIDKHVFAV